MRIIICSICVILINWLYSSNVFAQNDNASLVKVTGTLYSAEDSSKIEGRILYEKLPYYDDMGVSSSNANGEYTIFLVAENTYNIEASGSEYETLKIEFVPNANGDSQIIQDFYLYVSQELRLIKLDNLIFARGRSIISAESFEELDRLVQWLDERPNKIIQLEGHTDFQGNSSANMTLSQDRVDAVKDYLVQKGTKKSRVLTKAFGGTQPLSTERTDEAQTMNRRVEVRIIN